MSLMQVGEAFAGNDKVVIAKFDATANDIPSSLFKVQVCSPSSLLLQHGCYSFSTNSARCQYQP